MNLLSMGRARAIDLTRSFEIADGGSFMAPTSKISQPLQPASACGLPGVIARSRASECRPKRWRWRLVVLMLLVGTRLGAAPANDAFVNRIVISGSAIVT